MFRCVSTMCMLATAGIAANVTVAQTIGPGGERATLSSSIIVPSDKEGEVASGNHTAAMVWHGKSDFVNAVTDGATDEFKRLGIDVVAVTNAGYNAVRQFSDIETVLDKDPSIILSLPLDPVTSAAALEPAQEAGVTLVFLSNLPSGYSHLTDYASIVADDLFDMGKQAADALADAMGGRGSVGWMYHDADYYVTNQRDRAFKSTIENEYPDIEIVAEEGIMDPARAEEIADAILLKHPDIGGIYAPWAEPAAGVLAALRLVGNSTTKIVTLDLAEPIALDMVKGGNVAAIVADEAYELGRVMAAVGARAVVGVDSPPFIVAPAITVTRDTIADGWMKSLNRSAPQSVLDAAR